ncbi:MAG: hypothetical protein H7144_12010 [Burkholderiales bacterium]|nr:hypothetical protein [Phycisphaerae bacterium]
MSGTNCDIPRVFWAVMLPVSSVLTVVLAALTQSQLEAGVAFNASRVCQSSLFMSVFLGMFALIGVRITLHRAIEDHSRLRAAFIGILTLCVSAGFIVYGVQELT